MQNLINLARKTFGAMRGKGDRWHAITGNASGTVDVPGQPGLQYVRIPQAGANRYSTGVVQGGASDAGVPVVVEVSPFTKQRQISGGDIQGATYSGGALPGGEAVGLHGYRHGWLGVDQARIHTLQTYPIELKTAVAARSIGVGQGAFIANGVLYFKSTDTEVSLNGVGVWPVTGIKYVWLTLDSTGAGVIIDQAATTIGAVTWPVTGNFVMALCCLRAGTQTYQIKDTVDARQMGVGNVGWALTGNAGLSAATNFMGTTDNVDVVFKRNAVEWMRIDTSTATTPRVRIGMTGNPAGLTTYSGLSLYGDNASNSELHIIATGNGIYPTLSSWRSKGSVAGGLTAVVTDDYLFSFSGKGHDGTAWSSSQVAMRFLANGNWAVGDHPTRIAFYTTPAGSTTIDEHARLSRGDFRVLYNSTNYVAIQPASTCGTLTWIPERSGTVIVRTATPNIVGDSSGNARGGWAVDFQLHRNLATQVASGSSAVIVGGYNQTASGDYAFVGGGDGCLVSGSYSVATGGNDNTVSGNWAGTFGGRNNTSQGNYSFTCGRRAKTGANDGVFLFSDSTDADFNGAAANEFAIRARGGFRHAYDDSNYWKASISAAGVCTFSTLPAGAGFVFTPLVTLSSGASASASTFISALTDGSAGGFQAGTTSDVVLYRGAANTWQTPDRLFIGGDSTLGTTLFIQHTRTNTSSIFQHYNDAAYSVSNSVVITHSLNTSTSTRTALSITTNFDNVTDATRNSNVVFSLASAGTLGTTFTLNGRAMTVAGAFGCNGATAQTPYPSGGALAAYGAGANGLDTAAHMQDMYNLVVAIRAALVAQGTMS